MTISRKIEIAYWKGAQLAGCPWKGGDVYDTESEKGYWKTMKKILKTIDKAGYNYMVLNHPNFVTTVFIDSGRFRQS